MGLSFTWRAQNTVMNPGEEICWQSLDGLPNKGRVVFQSSNDGSGREQTVMILTLSYDLPEVALALFKKLGKTGKSFVEETLLGDLRRFKTRLLREMRDGRLQEFRES